MHQSFIVYRKAFYLWMAVILSAVCIGLYSWHDPTEPPNGGTWLGYTLGTVGAVLILWLMYFGVRKRNYTSTFGTVQGWLSAHIYLGTALLIIGTLHGGMQFGWNIHTAAYVFMCAVIISGFFGVYTYIRYPHLMTRNRRNQTREQMFQEVSELDEESLRMAQEVSPYAQSIVASAIDRTFVGGSGSAQLSGRDQSKVLIPKDMNNLDGETVLSPNPDQEKVIALLVDQQSRSEDPELTKQLQDLINTLRNKKEVLLQIRNDIRIHGILRIWLYFHVPLSFALIGSLIAHIISVFYYW